MNIPDISSSNSSLHDGANIVSQHNVQPQQAERQDEYIRQAQARKAKAQVPAREELKPKAEEPPDRFIQAPASSSAVYNVRDVSRNNKGGSSSQMGEDNKVLDVLLPMGRKRLRVFIEE
jgi:hypothetical protein